MVNFGAYVPNTSIANVTKLSVAFLHVVDDAKTDNSLLAEPHIVLKKQPFILGGDVKFLCFFQFDVRYFKPNWRRIYFIWLFKVR
jgi:hypothetical protein